MSLLLSSLLFLLIQQESWAFVVSWKPASVVTNTLLTNNNKRPSTSSTAPPPTSSRFFLSSSSFSDDGDDATTQSNNPHQQHHDEIIGTDAMAMLRKYKDYSIQDSFNLIVMGDLHLEDDMVNHYQARDDCLSALKELSLLPSPPSEQQQLVATAEANTCRSSSSRNTDIMIPIADSVPHHHDDDQDTVRLKYLLGPMKKVAAGELSLAQLEILLQEKKQEGGSHLINCHLVSLGDLGRKDIRHEPGDAGTTRSFLDARDYLDSFEVPYDLVTGNHDLEGLDEFDTDDANLQAWMKCFGKTQPYFAKQIGSRTLLVGLSTVRFRDSPHSSHECHVDQEQLEWFEQIVANHSDQDGWKIFVFTHAPIMGSNLRVLQNVHLVNGCAWMNHCCPTTRSRFIDTVKSSPQIKLWCSGHFHLSHDFPDSLSRVHQCTFVQVGVVGRKSTRDHTRQTRIIQGNDREIYIYTVNHHNIINAAVGVDECKCRVELRLDAKIDLQSGQMWRNNTTDKYVNSVDKETISTTTAGAAAMPSDPWFGAYIPQEEDGCYLESPSGKIASGKDMDEKVCWWHMHDGKVLGVHDGQIVEYDASTLSPLGIVVNRKELKDREVLIVGDDSKVVVLVDPETDEMEVVHPNDDGSYWRKYQRNKRIRQEEKAREMAAKLWLERKRADVVQ